MALPPTLRKEAEAYLALRAKPDVFDSDPSAPKRALASSTIRQQREHIRLAVSVLVRSGTPVEELRGLADLVRVDTFTRVIRYYHEQAGKNPNAFVVVLAKTLIDVSRYSVRVPEEHLKEMKRPAGKLPSVPFDLSSKNRRYLREIESQDMRARLVFLPEDLMRWVKAELQQGRLRFVEAQIAVAVAILLAAPLRPENLIELNVSRHLREPQGGRGKLVIYIAKDDTKTQKRDLTFELPAELAEPIRWYCREILARLRADPRGDLFVTIGGKRKSQETLSQQLTEIIGERVGIHMTPHQFRHLAAVAYLEEHPEDFQSVTDLLGHAWAKTTAIYAGSSTRRASRVYGEHVLEQRRQLQLRRHRRKASTDTRKLK
jgi:integrase